jgi:hypothetical protein
MPETQKDPVQEREMAQKFVQFVMMQAQNILYVLGKIATPDGRAMPPDLASAKMLIDQLETIEYKTRGNLIPQEEKLLKDALAQVRMVFVEASGGTPASMMPDRAPAYDFPDDGLDPMDADAAPEASQAAPAPTAKPATPAPASSVQSAPQDEENKKKFTKSYG